MIQKIDNWTTLEPTHEILWLGNGHLFVIQRFDRSWSAVASGASYDIIKHGFLSKERAKKAIVNELKDHCQRKIRDLQATVDILIDSGADDEPK